MKHYRYQELFFALGPLASAFFGFAAVPLMTWALTDSQISDFGLFQYTTLGLLSLVTLGLDQAYLKNAYTVDNVSMLLNKCVMPSVVFLCLLFVSTLCYMAVNGLSTTFATFVYLNVFFLILHRFSVQQLRVSGAGFYYFLSEILLKLPLIIFLLYLGLTSRNDDLTLVVILGSIISSIYLISVLSSFWMDACRIKTGKDFNPTSKELIKFGLPLSIGGVLYWSILNSTVFVSDNMLSDNETSILVVAISLSNLAAIGQTIFSMIWLPKIYKETSNSLKDVDFSNYARLSALIASLFFVIVILALYVIGYMLESNYFVSVQFAVALSVLPVLYTISEVTYIGVILKSKTYVALFIGGITSFFSIFISYLLAPVLGILGIIYAVVISAAIFLALRTYFGVKSLGGFDVSNVIAATVSIISTAMIALFLPQNLFFLSVLIMVPYFSKEFLLIKNTSIEIYFLINRYLRR